MRHVFVIVLYKRSIHKTHFKTLLETLLCTEGRPLEIIRCSIASKKSNGSFNLD